MNPPLCACSISVGLVHALTSALIQPRRRLPNHPFRRFDIPIDIINKPYLPVTSGEYSYSFGWALVIIQGIASVLMAACYGTEALTWTVVVSGVIGTVCVVRCKAGSDSMGPSPHGPWCCWVHPMHRTPTRTLSHHHSQSEICVGTSVGHIIFTLRFFGGSRSHTQVKD